MPAALVADFEGDGVFAMVELKINVIQTKTSETAQESLISANIM